VRRVGTAVRLSAFLGLLLAVVLGASIWATSLSFSSRSNAQAIADLTAVVQDYSRAAAAEPPGDLAPWTIRYLSSTVLPSGETLVISLGSQRYGSSDATVVLANPEIRQLLAHPPRTSVTTTIHSGSLNVLTLISPMRQGSSTVGAVLASYDLAPAAADHRRVLELALIEAAIALATGALGAYLLLRRLLGTVGRITTTARTIEEGDLDRRLGDQGTDDEVGELASTFDAMLDRIDEVMSVQRRLLADVSHQLKTPLTVVRGHLEVLGRTGAASPGEVRETIDVVVAEIDHMKQLTEQLLLLGRSLERDFIIVAPVATRAFVGDLVSSARVLGDRQFRVGDVDDLVVAIDEVKLRGALLNLVDNAVKATDPGDTIEVAASIRDSDGGVVFSVDDSGPGIPEEQRPTVLARFGRPDDETREGTGLGMSIVGAVAEAHGGCFEIGDSPLGGLSASVVLPATIVVESHQADRGDL